jgi:hypothetical protein
MDEGIVDEDGYPTHYALERISKWPFIDLENCFQFIKTIWHFAPHWGWDERFEPHEFRKNQTVKRYYISTGGWSGNENIISSMKNNHMLWACTWVQSKRGGHHIFELVE